MADQLGGSVFRKLSSSPFQKRGRPVVPWPRVSSLAGIRNKRAFFIRFSSRSMIPLSGGLRSSSAELMASTGTWIFSSSGEGS